MRYIDTHTHLDFYNDFSDFIDQCERDCRHTLMVTNLPELFARYYPLFKKLRFSRIALGYHPNSIGEFKFNKDLFQKLLPYTFFVGEVGLDFSSRTANHDKQIDIFSEILSLSKHQGHKLFSIHSRRAEKQVIDCLQSHKVEFGIFHWYSGPLKLISQITDSGFYFSVNPRMAVTVNGKKILKKIPPERMLFETDGPFVKWKGQIITPNVIPDCYATLEREIGITNLSSLIFQNFSHLLTQLFQKTGEKSFNYSRNNKVINRDTRSSP